MWMMRCRQDWGEPASGFGVLFNAHTHWCSQPTSTCTYIIILALYMDYRHIDNPHKCHSVEPPNDGCTGGLGGRGRRRRNTYHCRKVVPVCRWKSILNDLHVHVHVCVYLYVLHNSSDLWCVCVCVCVFRMLAAEHEGVRPDMVLLGKALSGGTFPVIAHLLIMIVTQRRLHTFTNYASTPSKCTTPTQPTSTR